MPIEEIIGDYRAFFQHQYDRLLDVGIDIAGCEISHLAYRTETGTEYLQTRDELEALCLSNIENVWNGRPISIMQLQNPLETGLGFTVPVIELIPPLHRRVYRMGLEHCGVVIGNSVDAFSQTHRAALTGQQFQSEECEPYYITFFDDFTMVKFYKESLLKICESQHGRSFEGFSHVPDWKFDN